MSKHSLRQQALKYHQEPIPGKIEVSLTKSTSNQKDLALAYTPGVAEPVREIAKDPSAAYKYTSKGNLVGVVSNGSAVLGLGNVGALASKPVMEGKAVLFKKFANIDVFDIEINADNPEEFISTVRRIAPTFGGINLEDIKAPECFAIEKALIKQLDIPVLHDDQHGTAVIIAAGLKNAIKLQNKQLQAIKVVCAGAGAAGIASMRLLVNLGVKRKNICMVDRKGIIHAGRTDLNEYKFAFSIETKKRTLADACVDADVFIGVSGPDILTKKMLQSMAAHPIVFALSNPDPEINPELAHRVREDLIMATGRSDYPNQVNNVLGFPYIFRGALDANAKTINQAMLLAAVDAIAELVHEPMPTEVLTAYGLSTALEFGSDYIIPKPTDPRLLLRVSSAVKQAAIDSGVTK